MTDLRTMLHESAPTPRRPLDMVDVRRRAQRSGARRALAWLGAVGAVVALGVPVGGSLLAPAGEGAVDAVGGPRATTTTTSTPDDVGFDGPESATRVAESPAPETGTDAAGAAASLGTSGQASPDLSPSPTAPPPPAAVASDADDGAYPPGAGCSVDDAGLGPDERRTCRFTATEVGGASMQTDSAVDSPGTQPKGLVTVTRDGVSTTYELGTTRARAQDPTGEELGVFLDGCRHGPFIQPGDLVEAVITRTSSTPPAATTTLIAGEEWAC